LRSVKCSLPRIVWVTQAVYVSSGGSRQARAETAVCARLSHRARTRTLNPPHASGLLLFDVRTTQFLCLTCLSHAAEVQQPESWCVRCSSYSRALFGVVAVDMWTACRARWSRRRHPARRQHRWASRMCCPGSGATTLRQGPLHLSMIPTAIKVRVASDRSQAPPSVHHAAARVTPAERVSG